MNLKSRWSILAIVILSIVFTACDNNKTEPAEEGISTAELVSMMTQSLAELEAAEIDVEYFYQNGDEEPFTDEFIMLMQRDTNDPAVSSKIMIEPYNKYTGYLLTYVDGRYMAIDSNNRQVLVTEKKVGGAERIRKNYRGEIASVYFDKLYDFEPPEAVNYMEADTSINGKDFYTFVSVSEDTTSGTSERYIWLVDKADNLPKRWQRIYTKGDLNVFQQVDIKSIETKLNPNQLVFDIDYPEGFEIKYDTVLTDRQMLLEVGDKGPDFTLQFANGESYSLDTTTGKPTIIKFWGTWCGYCKRTLPLLENVAKNYGDKVNIIGISANEAEGADPQGYLEKQGYSLKTLVNGEGVAADYQVIGFPTVYLLDSTGVILKSFVGYDKDLDSKLSSTLEEIL